jgi:acyl carrier protein
MVSWAFMVSWVLIGVLAVALLGGGLYSYFIERRQLRRMLDHLFAARASGNTYDDDAFANACGPDIPPGLARQVRMVILEMTDDWFAPPKKQIVLEDIRPEAHLWEQLGGKFDSIGVLDLLFRLEKALEMGFPTGTIGPDDWATVASLVRAAAREMRKMGRI